MKWEYCKFYLNFDSNYDLEAFNELGQAGWEFCFQYNEGTLIFKRPIGEVKVTFECRGLGRYENTIKEIQERLSNVKPQKI